MQLHTLAIAAGCALILAACGIRGPLYLPQVPEAPAQFAPLPDTDHNKQANTD